MAEIKNSFLKSKMNKDLDDRLIPNGEYRDAQNISVGKSEADDIGALETVLGNTLVAFTNYGNQLKVIGYLNDERSNSIYVFLTDNNQLWTDTTTSSPITGAGSNHFIIRYKPNGSAGGEKTTLVSGSFLNFSQQSLITGVSLVENLLFWTDNRNQPRKINVTNAAPYYTRENQISVAKYNPYEPISLLKSTTSIAGAASVSTTITLSAANTAIKKGMSVISPTITAYEYIYVTNISGVTVTVNAAATVADLDVLTFLTTTMTGENISPYFNNVEMPNTTTWPGDPDYLESRFVRFSYRFQYDDGEYSIMAPFTQIAYIPKQKGYFLEGNEDDAYRSTILNWMENGVQNVELNIPLPDSCEGLFNQTNYKISNIDVLYKESDQNVVKVLDSISVTSTAFGDIIGNVYTYNYQSRKPFKTLAQSQTTRVYDKVPVRAFAQEISGNRVIYGNFQSQNTAPQTVNYYVTSGNKNTSLQTNWVEYPNHSIKQNRNYQVGFILADKFGRQSSVILSSVKLTGINSGGIQYGGSTVYTAYDSAASDIKNWFGEALQVVVEGEINQAQNVELGAPGLYAQPIGTGFNVFGGTPTVDNSIFTYTFNNTSTPSDIPVVNSYLRGEYLDFVKVTNITGTNPYVVTCDGAINEGIYESTELTGPDKKYAYTLDSVDSFNATGWYSYKVVVRQQEQDYYNVYLPGILNGYPSQFAVIPEYAQIATTVNQGAVQIQLTSSPSAIAGYVVKLSGMIIATINSISENATGSLLDTTPTLISLTTGTTVSIEKPDDYIPFPSGETDKTANIVLINDNINKIPRDLAEVGPDQKQFRSSVQLFGRVTNTFQPNPLPSSTIVTANNKQYYPGVSTDTAVSISTAKDSNIVYNELTITPGNKFSVGGQDNLYQLDTNPLIARLSTNPNNIIGVVSDKMLPFLAIYETEPQESLLDIFWETTQTGLIADLNQDVLNGFDGATNFGAFSTVFEEDDVAGTEITNGWFYPVNATGVELPQTIAEKMTMTVLQGATDVTSQFCLEQNQVVGGTDFGRYKIRTAQAAGVCTGQTNTTFAYVFGSITSGVYNFSFVVTYNEDTPTINKTVVLVNKAPTFDAGVSFPTVVSDVGVSTVVTRAATNGTADTNRLTEGLKYTIETGNDDSYFSITATGGVITKLITTPIGSYSLGIKVADAYNVGTDQFDVNSKFVTQNQTVVVGPQGVNSNVTTDSSCVITGIPGSPFTRGISSPGSTSNNTLITGVWYLTTNALPGSPTYGLTGDLPVQPTASYTDPNDAAFQSFNIHRLGSSSLSQGTLLFSCNMQIKRSVAGPANADGQGEWSIYYRAFGGNWTLATDTNNYTSQANVVTKVKSNSSTIKYTQVVFAFDTAGEYCIVCTDLTTTASASNADAVCAWVNSSDLYYSTCVQEDGVNRTMTPTGTDPKNYQYNITPGGVGYACSSTTTIKYAQHPYGNYVNSFYDGSNLQVPYTGDSSIAEFYNFKTKTTGPAEPFNDYTYSSNFSTLGIKIDSGLGALHPCNSASQNQYALGCISGVITCAHIEMPEVN
jgi:hypothetical protein